jgi:hypothetical protein
MADLSFETSTEEHPQCPIARDHSNVLDGSLTEGQWLIDNLSLGPESRLSMLAHLASARGRCVCHGLVASHIEHKRLELPTLLRKYLVQLSQVL